MASLRTLRHQFRLADQALHEADHLFLARYWASCVSNAYQVVLRSAAGLLYGLGASPVTEKEVRIAFAAAFVSPGLSQTRFDEAFRRLERMRHAADFDPGHTGTEADAEIARRLAHEFRAEALRLERDVLQARKEALK